MDAADLYGDDDDILEAAQKDKAKRNRNIDGITGHDGENLHDKLYGALGDYVDTRRANIENSTPTEFRMTSQLLDYWSSTREYNQGGAAIISLAEILDEITDGTMKNLFRYHDSRRRIVFSSIIKRNLGMILDILDPSDTSHYINELYIFLDLHYEYICYVRDEAVDEYRYWSELLEREVDETFVESGIMTTRSFWDKMFLGHPMAYNDELD